MSLKRRLQRLEEQTRPQGDYDYYVRFHDYDERTYTCVPFGQRHTAESPIITADELASLQQTSRVYLIDFLPDRIRDMFGKAHDEPQA
ncbi:MAG: hypothetical protein AAF126_23350 [Chloroflexota bacterium]